MYDNHGPISGPNSKAPATNPDLPLGGGRCAAPRRRRSCLARCVPPPPSGEIRLEACRWEKHHSFKNKQLSHKNSSRITGQSSWSVSVSSMVFFFWGSGSFTHHQHPVAAGLWTRRPSSGSTTILGRSLTSTPQNWPRSVAN